MYVYTKGKETKINFLIKSILFMNEAQTQVWNGTLEAITADIRQLNIPRSKKKKKKKGRTPEPRILDQFIK